MFERQRILAVIPARGGSKGLLRKNIRKIDGKPLLAWTVKEAKKSVFIDRLILSSEDEEIIRVARKIGLEVPFVRPDTLAEDTSSCQEVACHAALEITGYDYVVLLQPTSPLRHAEDIDGCIRACILAGAETAFSVVTPDKSPYWMFTIGKNSELKPLHGEKYFRQQRQQLPKVVLPNGAIYVARTDFLLKEKTFLSKNTVSYEMPTNRSLDIDSQLDFDFFTFLVTSRIQDQNEHL